MIRKLLILFFFTVNYQYLTAQILDDTTKNVYGPTTTEYRLFEDIKLNRGTIYHPDTTIERFHIFNFVNEYENKLQDLGNIGTAAKPVYYQPPSRIGWTSGYYVYDPYFIPFDKIKLFNTRSPYTHLYVILGGGGRNETLVEHSQNITPRWGFGGTFRKLTITKQISRLGRDDNEVESTAYNAYMYYWNKDSSYMALGTFSRMNHLVDESGGIDDSEFERDEQFFDTDNVDVNLENAGSRELNMNYFLYQQYSLNKLFTLYNEFYRSLVTNYFMEEQLSSEADFFSNIYFNTDETFHRNKFNIFRNESGIKGDLEKAFYNLYFKYRNAAYKPGNLIDNEIRNETYLGGNIRYDNDSTFYLKVSGELMNNGNHSIAGLYENRLWILSYHRLMYEPSAIHERYFNNHYEWYNDFGSVQSDNIKGLFKIDINELKIRPNLSFSNVFNYIYFDTEKLPVQEGSSIQLYSPGLDLTFDVTRNIHLTASFIYTFKTGSEASDIFRIPPMFANANIYFSDFLFNDKLLVSLGLDAHYKSAYFADGYDPVTQQFYLQNDFEIPSYLIMDAYLNFKIRTVKVFLKMTYFNQGNLAGYFTTPYYTGQSRILDFGVSWMFYD